MTIGQSIKRRRKAAKLAQWELAERMNCNQCMISDWELGYRNPSWTYLQLLVKQFGLEVITDAIQDK